MKQEKVILGITAFNHDSSACLIYNGEVVGFCEEERLNHIKHTGDFPFQAIDFCLKQAKLTINDVTDIAFYFNPSKCIKNYFKNNSLICYFLTPHIFIRKRFYYEAIWLLSFINKINSIKRLIKNKNIKINYIDHHQCHIWYGYYASNFKNCSVISNDSVGENISSLAINIREENGTLIFKELFSQNDPHSLGYLYGAMTEFLGFKRGSDEGKVMALSALGTNRYSDYFDSAVKYLLNGEFRLNDNLIWQRNFQPKAQRVSDKFISKIGNYRKKEEKLTQIHYDIAYALQEIIEKVLHHQLNHINNDNIVITGGVAQNSVANGKMNNIFKQKNIFIPPIPNDAGCSLGAAIALHYKYFESMPSRKDTAFLASDFSNDKIVKILENNKIFFKKIDYSLEFMINEIIKNKVIAIFRGKMECGPRALGNRSIIANPINPRIKDYLNQKIKNREFFQPYGGLILDKWVKKIFDYKNESIKGKYMSFVYSVKKEWLVKFPSLVHYDKSCRIQIIEKNQDKFLEKLLEEFEKKTGVPLLINTSLNLRGQTIAQSPQDALNTFYNSGIDHLIFNDSILISK